jgi:hypothetical protein
MNKKNSINKTFDVAKFDKKYPVIDERYDFNSESDNFDFDISVTYRVKKPCGVPLNVAQRSLDYKCCEPKFTEIEILHDIEHIKKGYSPRTEDILNMSYDKNILSTDTEIGIKFNLTSERIKQIRKKTIEEIKKSLKYTGYNSNYEGNLF